jgi:hypothetical protein
MAALLNLEDGGEDDERKIEIFKDWKALAASTLQEKVYSPLSTE